MAQEYIKLGQRVKAFKVDALVSGQWQTVASQTTIGYKRILRFPTVTATKVRLTITDAKASPLISNIGIYKAPQILTAPTITRNKAGDISIKADDSESVIYYSLDGSTPTKTAAKYGSPINTTGKVSVKAFAYDAGTGKSGPISAESFDIVHKDWKILNVEDSKVNDAIDGNTASAWYQPRDKKLPADLVIDLGKSQDLTGFKYLPGQGRTTGIITNYQFYVSDDAQNWKLASEGEFSNIQNNPLWQTKKFETVKARYIKLTALRNTQNNDATGYAEIDVITP